MQALSKTLYLLLVVLLITYSCHAQKNLKAYAYLQNDYDIRRIELTGINIETRTKGDIFMNGGNDYKITSYDRRINKEIKKAYWAIEANNTLYVNCWVIMRSLGYAKVLYHTTNYIFFAADKGMVDGGYNDGMIVAQEMFTPMRRYNHLMDLRTGRVCFVTEQLMQYILTDKPDLQKQYNAERYPVTNDTIMKYLAELDKK